MQNSEHLLEVSGFIEPQLSVFLDYFLLKRLLFRPKISNFIILVKVVIIKGPMLVTPDCNSFIDFPPI